LLVLKNVRKPQNIPNSTCEWWKYQCLSMERKFSVYPNFNALWTSYIYFTYFAIIVFKYEIQHTVLGLFCIFVMFGYLNSLRMLITHGRRNGLNRRQVWILEACICLLNVCAYIINCFKYHQNILTITKSDVKINLKST